MRAFSCSPKLAATNTRKAFELTKLRSYTAWCGYRWVNPSKMYHISQSGMTLPTGDSSVVPTTIGLVVSVKKENFLDVAHFPFVHGGLLGDAERSVIDDYEVETHSDGITLRNVRVWQPDPDGTGQGAKVTYNYHVFRPLTAYFSKETNGRRLTIFFSVTPVEESECIGWMWIAMNYAYGLPEDELRAFQDRVVLQDIPVVESQRPQRLPLDLQTEFHLPCDRASIAYRKWLKHLGVSFGTI